MIMLLLSAVKTAGKDEMMKVKQDDTTVRLHENQCPDMGHMG